MYRIMVTSYLPYGTARLPACDMPDSSDGLVVVCR